MTLTVQTEKRRPRRVTLAMNLWSAIQYVPVQVVLFKHKSCH
jgi:hypothetical protein